MQEPGVVDVGMLLERLGGTASVPPARSAKRLASSNSARCAARMEFADSLIASRAALRPLSRAAFLSARFMRISSAIGARSAATSSKATQRRWLVACPNGNRTGTRPPFVRRRYNDLPMRTEFREEPCKTALNPVKGMQFKWSLNPYMGCAHQCTFCYVRAFERRADRPSDSRYGASIRVKVNIPQVLRQEVTRSKWKHESIAIGAATDPYQPAEGKYRLTRGCLEVLCCVSNPFSIVTRGPMIVRDIDLLKEGSGRAPVEVNFSIPTLDPEAWRKSEPGTAPPRQRLRALKTLVDAGIKAGVGMAPLLPGITDKPDLMRDVVRAARDAGAVHLWANVLNLRPGTREHFMENLARDWPEQSAHYERLYQQPYLSKAVSEPVFERVRELRAEYDIGDRRRQPIEPEPAPQQLPLFGSSQVA